MNQSGNDPAAAVFGRCGPRARRRRRGLSGTLHGDRKRWIINLIHRMWLTRCRSVSFPSCRPRKNRHRDESVGKEDFAPGVV